MAALDYVPGEEPTDTGGRHRTRPPERPITEPSRDSTDCRAGRASRTAPCHRLNMRAEADGNSDPPASSRPHTRLEDRVGDIKQPNRLPRVG
jgi:hypothetical protein